MPKRLPTPTTRVTWRVDADDLALLTAIHGGEEGNLNAWVREVLHRAAEHYRVKLGARRTADSGPTEPQVADPADPA